MEAGVASWLAWGRVSTEGHAQVCGLQICYSLDNGDPQTEKSTNRLLDKATDELPVLRDHPWF